MGDKISYVEADLTAYALPSGAAVRLSRLFWEAKGCTCWRLPLALGLSTRACPLLH